VIKLTAKTGGVIRIWVSRPAELPRQPLSEPDVNLSIHTAPIKQSSFLPRLPSKPAAPLSAVLQQLSPDAQTTLIKTLGTNLTSIIKILDNLVEVLNTLSHNPDAQTVFLTSFDSAHLASLIKNDEDLERVAHTLSYGSQEILFLSRYIEVLSPDAQIALMTKMSPLEREDLNLMLEKLSPAAYITFTKGYVGELSPDDQIAFITKAGSQLGSIASYDDFEPKVLMSVV